MISILLNFLNEDSAFMLIEKLLSELNYEEIVTRDFLEKERVFLLKTFMLTNEESSENLLKIIDPMIFRLYSGVFFDQALDFPISMRIFEKILEKPCVSLYFSL